MYFLYYILDLHCVYSVLSGGRGSRILRSRLDSQRCDACVPLKTQLPTMSDWASSVCKMKNMCGGAIVMCSDFCVLFFKL